MDISGVIPVRLLVVCLTLSVSLVGGPPPRAQELSARTWEECLTAPDRACVLEEAMDLVYLLDRTDRRQAFVAAVAETWARAGEVDKAKGLAVQVPDRMLARVSLLRE